MSLPRVHGWTATPDDLQKARVSFLASPNPTFHISDPQPPVNSQSLFLEGLDDTRTGSSSRIILSDTNSLSEQILDAKERRSESNWVARPRNEFILFRCEFVRQHSGEAKRLNRPAGQDTEKTLSKQAADAWHCLSSEERSYWKEKANCERTEHARRYPEYRYRPRKNLGHKRSARSLSIQSPQPGPFQAGGRASDLHAQLQSSQLRSSSGPFPPVGRRRALSVPGFTAASQQPIHAELVELSPPSSAPPHKVSFEPDEYQVSVARPATLTRYRSTPSIGPLGAIDQRRTESMMPMTQPYYSTYPEWNTQEQSSPHSSLLALSSLNLRDETELFHYTTGGDPLDLTFLDYQQNEDEMWLPQLYPLTNPSSRAFSPSTPISRGITDGFAFEELTEPPGVQSHPQQRMPCTEHEQSGVTAPSNPHLSFLDEESRFFSPEL